MSNHSIFFSKFGGFNSLRRLPKRLGRDDAGAPTAHAHSVAPVPRQSFRKFTKDAKLVDNRMTVPKMDILFVSVSSAPARPAPYPMYPSGQPQS